MNFIPVSYFWFLLWRSKRTVRSLLSIISTVAVTRHLGAIFRTFAREEAKKKSTSLRLISCANSYSSSLRPLSFLLLISSPSQTRIPQTPPGSMKYVRDACLDAGDVLREKMQTAAILPLYLEISRLNIGTKKSRRTDETYPRHSPHFQFLWPCHFIRTGLPMALLIVPLTDVGEY